MPIVSSITHLTRHVNCCCGGTQNPFLVTSCSRVRGEYRPALRASRDAFAADISGFWCSAIRSSWIPPVPETRRAPDLSAQDPAAAKPRGLVFCDSTKGDGTPKGAVMLPFLVRDRTPVRPTSACVAALRLPVKVQVLSSRKHAMECNGGWHAADGVTMAPCFVTFRAPRSVRCTTRPTTTSS